MTVTLYFRISIQRAWRQRHAVDCCSRPIHLASTTSSPASLLPLAPAFTLTCSSALPQQRVSHASRRSNT
ncbi:hypothetical protein IG631_02702 [Alternaria alternata]|nr:hypothetical protein IG631_02702 [Alternaria alternata]